VGEAPLRARSSRRRRARPAKRVAPAPGEIEEIAARAARLGVTVERVLEEYAHIAFADLRHIVEWGPQGVVFKPAETLSEADAAAISEIAPTGGPGKYRVKLYNKKAALDAIARHLGMFPAPPRRRDDDAPAEQGEDPRDVLARKVARLAARGDAAEPDLDPEPGAGG
jgi:phage terminase small subunit